MHKVLKPLSHLPSFQLHNQRLLRPREPPFLKRPVLIRRSVELDIEMP